MTAELKSTRTDKIKPLSSLNGSTNNTETKDDTDYGALLAGAEVRPTDQIDEAPACIIIDQDGQQSIIGTLGNISAFMGKPKAKKSFTVAIVVSALVGTQKAINVVKGSLPENQSTVLMFDSEQSRFHVLRAVKRICKLSGVDVPGNLKVYGLRKHAPNVRLKLIEWAIYNTPNVGLVVIDGVRDLAVDPILKAEDSSQIMTCLLKWSEERNIHILTVLHLNKTDGNARGHIGTELTHKAETVLIVEKDNHDPDTSVVRPEFCRNKEFTPFRFSVDSTGIPYAVDSQTDGLDTIVENRYGTFRTTRIPKPTADNIDPQTVDAIITRAFAKDSQLGYSQLRTAVIEASEHVGKPLAKSRAENFIQRVAQQGRIEKFTPEKSRYDAYRLPDVDRSTQPS